MHAWMHVSAYNILMYISTYTICYFIGKYSSTYKSHPVSTCNQEKIKLDSLSEGATSTGQWLEFATS